MEPEQERLYAGLSHAAWGYFFLHIDFKLGTVSILPQFVGWLLLLSAITALSGERRELGLLRPLGIIGALWALADWLFSWGGGSADGHILFLDLLIGVLTLYFHFQFLTDLSALAERYQPADGTLAHRLLRRRTLYTLSITAFTLTGELRQLLPWTGWKWVVVGTTVLALAAALLIMANLFELRGCFRDRAGSQQTE